MNDSAAKFHHGFTLMSEALQELIREELKSVFIPEAEARLAGAAARLETAYKALQDAQGPLKALDRELAVAERKAAENAPDTPVEARVSARALKEHWRAEIEAIKTRRADAERVVVPLDADYRECQRVMRELQDDLFLLECNLSFPLLGYGQRTDAYKVYRLGYGSIAHVLLFSDENNPEWQQGIKWLESLCMTTGYRTDSLPDENAHTRAFWDTVFAEHAATRNADTAKVWVDKIADQVDRKDDYRFYPAKSRPEMRVPKVGGDHKRI